MFFELKSLYLYETFPQNYNDLKECSNNIPVDCRNLIINLQHLKYLDDPQINVILRMHEMVNLYLNLNSKKFFFDILEMQSLIGFLNIFDKTTHIEDFVSGKIPHEITDNTVKIFGTLRGKQVAYALYELIESINNDIFVDLNECYGWDEDYCHIIYKLKKIKDIFLIRKNRAHKTIKKLFKINIGPIYDAHKNITAYNQKFLKQVNLVGKWKLYRLSCSEQEHLIQFFRFVFNHQDSEICLNIGYLHKLNFVLRNLSEDRYGTELTLISFIEQILKKQKKLILITNLPRNETIAENPISYSYKKGIPIISSEKELDAFLNLSQNQFSCEKDKSFATISLASVWDRQRATWSFSDILTFDNTLKALINPTQKHIVIFDFSKAYCFPIEIWNTVFSLPAIIKLVICNKHLQELAKLAFEEKKDENLHFPLFYEDINIAINKHFYDMLIITNNKEEWDKIAIKIDEKFGSQGSKKLQINVTNDLKLVRNFYSLIVVDGEQYSLDISCLQEFARRVIEIKTDRDQKHTTQYLSYQIENKNQEYVVEKVIENLLLLDRPKEIIIFDQVDWVKIGKDFHAYLDKKDLLLVENFFGKMKDNSLEVLFFKSREEPSIIILQNLEKIRRCIFYKKDKKTELFYYNTRVLDACSQIDFLKSQKDYLSNSLIPKFDFILEHVSSDILNEYFDSQIVLQDPFLIYFFSKNLQLKHILLYVSFYNGNYEDLFETMLNRFIQTKKPKSDSQVLCALLHGILVNIKKILMPNYMVISINPSGIPEITIKSMDFDFNSIIELTKIIDGFLFNVNVSSQFDMMLLEKNLKIINKMYLSIKALYQDELNTITEDHLKRSTLEMFIFDAIKTETFISLPEKRAKEKITQKLNKLMQECYFPSVEKLDKKYLDLFSKSDKEHRTVKIFFNRLILEDHYPDSDIPHKASNLEFNSIILRVSL